MLRRSCDWITQPRSVNSARTACTMRNVASTWLCSSMSTVTVVPAARAAAQMREMFSVAVFSP